MKNNSIAAIILAGGKGKRINSKRINKVSRLFNGKPLIVFGVDLLKEIASPLIVVIGAYRQSVKKNLKGYNITYRVQKEQLGTAHALKIGLKAIKDKTAIKYVLVGYGDHLMFYTKETIERLIRFHKKSKADISLITTEYNHPSELKWGRIVRKKNNQVVKIVEEKDADKEEKKIKELNAGFYCFNYQFLKNNISQVKRSSVTGEYYLTDLIRIAHQQSKRVAGLKVPFEEVGIGVNTKEELERSERLYRKFKKVEPRG